MQPHSHHTIPWPFFIIKANEDRSQIWVTYSSIKTDEAKLGNSDMWAKCFKFGPDQNLEKVIEMKEGGSFWNDDWNLPADCGTVDEFFGKE